MKRLVTCAAIASVIAVAIVGTVARMTAPQVQAADRDAPLRRSAVRAQVDTPAAAAAAAESNPLREQVLERLKAKVELMNDEDLQKALETLNVEIQELEAAKRLQQASETLQSIIDEYGKTTSARRAARMLDAKDKDAAIEALPYGGAG